MADAGAYGRPSNYGPTSGGEQLQFFSSNYNQYGIYSLYLKTLDTVTDVSRSPDWRLQEQYARNTAEWKKHSYSWLRYIQIIGREHGLACCVF